MATMMLRVREKRTQATELPRWPLAMMLAGYPLWWVLGFGEMAWIPLGACMLVLLIRSGRYEVPRGFGVWLLFLVCMSVAVIGIDSPGRLTGFIYRALLYFTVTVVFLYIYNAREQLTMRYVLGLVTVFWGFTVLGGYASVFFPHFSFTTPLAYILPSGLQSNELVGEMVVRRLTQHNPDGWFDLEPRPSAPFLYTNQWGNVYSLTLPLVVAYLAIVRTGARVWLLGLGIVLSLIPAMLTLNRGMFIGLAVTWAYLLFRFVLSGQFRRVFLLASAGVVGAVIGLLIDVGDRVLDRTETSSSTEDRANLYSETFTRTLESPVFGYGAPRPSVTEGMPSAGTQGHFWTIMFSFGFPALIFFVGALVWLFFATRRVTNTAQLLLHTVQLVILIEMLYYGILPHGLIISFTAAALVLREHGVPAHSQHSRLHRSNIT